MNWFSYYRMTQVHLFEHYILSTFIRYKAGTLNDIVILLFGVVMLLSLRRPLCHQLPGIHLCPVHLSTGKGPTGTFNADGALDDFEPWTGLHQPPPTTRRSGYPGASPW